MPPYPTSQTDRDLTRWMAVAMAIVFAQGIVGTFMHFDGEDHYFCVEHQQITHDGDHARQAHQDRQTTVAGTSHDRDGRPSDEDDRRQSEDCLWLTWLQNSSHASPDLTPDMLDLPPPATEASTDTPRDHIRTRQPISLRYVSPINSPPST